MAVLTDLPQFAALNIRIFNPLKWHYKCRYSWHRDSLDPSGKSGKAERQIPMNEMNEKKRKLKTATLRKKK